MMLYIKAMRIHQWVKNILVFVPLLAAHHYKSRPEFVLVCVAFLVFGLIASSVYILNDLLDVEDDRQHPSKCLRPFASRALSTRVGWSLWPILFILGITVAVTLLPIQFVGALIAYFLLTLAYSLRLKRLPIIDVVVLAGLYTMRVVAGAVAIDVPLSFWLFTFSIFLFTSLAFVKRFSELLAAGQDQPSALLRGRGYYRNDLQAVGNFGAASGYLAVLVFSLYIQDSLTAKLYSEPRVLWIICPLLLFWISRIWLLTHRGGMHDDPVVFAIKDKTSWVIMGMIMIAMGLARVGVHM